MKITDMSLSFNERLIFSLRSLYGSYGYSQYKMSKFEEYDLYARNKEFLISDSVITFTDTNGKLMALKPDVTLSIIKNTKDAETGVQKVYYNENVYRASKGSSAFKEIMQVGIECIGSIDNYSVCEVVGLAGESLKRISADCLMDISDLSVISCILDSFGLTGSGRDEILGYISRKNIHELERTCLEMGVSEENTRILSSIVTANGKASEVLPGVRESLGRLSLEGTLERLETLIDALSDGEVSDILRIDFSVIDDVKYYNGIVFKGFVNGVPGVVLSGGQYDNLMKKMKRKSGAIGFAVYLDMLERMEKSSSDYDVDTVVLYDDDADLKGLSLCIRELSRSGKVLAAGYNVPLNIKYRRLGKYKDGEVEILEDNA